MGHFKLVGHELVNVLTVRLEDVFMQHEAMNDGENTVDTIDSQKDDIAEITGGNDQFAESKDQYKAMDKEPTSPAKQRAFFRKFKKLKMITDMADTVRRTGSMKETL